MNNKKGLANLATFSLILLLLFTLFILTYTYYRDTKDSLEDTNTELELVLTSGSLRTELIELSARNGSSFNYTDTLSSSSAIMYLNSSQIKTRQYGKTRVVEYNTTLFGLEFCNQYNLSPAAVSTFTYNGSCFSMSTN